MSPLVEVHDDAAALATSVAGELLTRLADAQALGHVPHVVLTGGTIADAVHHEVARLAVGSEVDWSRVVFWWGDERFVGPDDADRNAGQAREALLDAVAVDPSNIHEMASTATAASAAEGAAAYAAELAAHGPAGFEVVMLGVGPDGHVASLFPDRPELDATDPVVAVTDSPKPPSERISLTLSTLNQGRAVWLLASGTGKAPAVALALGADAGVHPVPAAAVSGTAETIWFLDRDAAANL